MLLSLPQSLSYATEATATVIDMGATHKILH